MIRFAYFAKNLPIRGEIKEGDSFAFKSLTSESLVASEVTDTEVIVHYPIGSTTYTNKSALTKTGLFLCSHNMEKGDRVYHAEGNAEGNYGIVDSLTTTLTLYNIRFEKSFTSTCHIEDLVRVVGLISPKATWIKHNHIFRGDEFGNPLDKLMVNPFTPMPVNIFLNVYPIKCDCCGTFK